MVGVLTLMLLIITDVLAVVLLRPNDQSLDGACDSSNFTPKTKLFFYCETVSNASVHA